MVDLPNQAGPMCEWPQLQLVDGALACLQKLNRDGQCHLATNAEDSTEKQIRQALHSAGLSNEIEHIFCTENLSATKMEDDYFPRIIAKLQIPAEQITVIGDSLEKDIYPALGIGLKAIWFNPNGRLIPQNIQSIQNLSQLPLSEPN